MCCWHFPNDGRYFLTRSLDQTCERFLQPSGKFLIDASNLAQQSLNRNPESPREFGSVQLPDEGALELRGHSAWQQVHATAMDRWKAVANAGQRQRGVADAAYHVFRLPHISSGDASPRMKCVQPAKANDVPRRRWRYMPGLIRLPEHKAECWRQGSEFRRGHEGEIDLQSAREKKHAVNPLAGPDVKMMQGEMPMVHVRRPIGEDIRQFGGIADAKSEIYVRPPVFVCGGRGASDRGATDALVTGGVFQKARPQASSFFRSKHKPVRSSFSRCL
jgi:hypothetical protein